MRREGQRRDDAEVPATAPTAGPEQVGVCVLVDRAQVPVRGHDLDLTKGVAGEPVPADEHPDAAAQGQAGDANRRARAARERPTLGTDRRIDPREGCTCADANLIVGEKLHALETA